MTVHCHRDVVVFHDWIDIDTFGLLILLCHRFPMLLLVAHPRVTSPMFDAPWKAESVSDLCVASNSAHARWSGSSGHDMSRKSVHVSLLESQRVLRHSDALQPCTACFMSCIAGSVDDALCTLTHIHVLLFSRKVVCSLRRGDTRRFQERSACHWLYRRCWNTRVRDGI